MSSIQIPSTDARLRNSEDSTAASFTVLFWLRPTATIADNERILILNNVLTMVCVDGPDRLRLIDNGDWLFTTFDTAVTLTSGTNVHVAIKGTANADVRLYINGAFANSETVTTSAPGYSTGIHLGESGASIPMEGEYGDWLLFNRPLGDDEISSIYASYGRHGMYRNATLRAVMIEGATGTTVTDGLVKNMVEGYTNAINQDGASNITFGEGRLPIGYRRRAA